MACHRLQCNHALTLVPGFLLGGCTSPQGSGRARLRPAVPSLPCSTPRHSSLAICSVAARLAGLQVGRPSPRQVTPPRPGCLVPPQAAFRAHRRLQVQSGSMVHPATPCLPTHRRRRRSPSPPPAGRVRRRRGQPAAGGMQPRRKKREVPQLGYMPGLEEAYELGKEIGRGGNGVVRLARHRTTGALRSPPRCGCSCSGLTRCPCVMARAFSLRRASK